MGGSTKAIALAALATLAAPASAQQQAPAPDPLDGPIAPITPATASPDTPATASPDASDVVVIGTRIRGSAITDTAPLATFDANAIAATGATSISEFLRTIRGVTQSADGADPIFLLNAQRVSGYGEIGTLPPEAIDKVEVLPEPSALRFGFPPTRRVLNFITKRRFAQAEVKGTIGTSTRGGADNAELHGGFTRLHDDGRVTLEANARHTDALRQDARSILPDPDILFDPRGNVVGLAGGEVDPALSAVAGTPVIAAPVPDAPVPTGHPTLAGFAAGANRPRLFDLGPFRTLAPANDAYRAEAVVANRVGGTLAGTINLSAETSRDRTLAGPAALTLRVPRGPASPFSTDVLLQRYLLEADLLRLRQTTVTLHAGTTVRGAWRGWRWDLTASLDQQRISGSSDRGVDPAPANAAVAAGTADPFAPLPPALLANRLVDRAAQRTRTAATKLVATAAPVRLPAGEVSVTATLEAERVSARSVTTGASPFALAIGRTRAEGGVTLDLPLASRREGFLAGAGELSVNAALAVRDVGGFGTLADWSGGVTWAPVTGIQLIGLLRHAEAPPPLAQQATPVVSIPNATVLDYGSGRSALVTLVLGGNPALRPERRDVASLALNVKPFAGREWRVGATLSDTVIRDQTANVYALTPLTEAALPGRFVRDASGRLVTVRYQPLNLARERQRTLAVTLNTYGQLGTPKPPAAPGGQPPPRPSYYGGLGPTFRFSDRLRLAAAGPVFDILGGDTINGSGTARFTAYGYGGLNHLGNGVTFNFWYSAAARVSGGGLPAADLRFAPIFKLNLGGSLSAHHFLPKADWTRHLGVKLDVTNVTGARQRVRDAAGQVPNRFQPDYLDPLGRTVTLSLRKLF